MITGTSINYTGRRVDLSLYPAIRLSGVPVSNEFSQAPKAVAGLSALVQNFARILLTPEGTFRGDPTMGTNFFKKISAGGIRYPADIEHSFLIEASKAAEYMATATDPSTPLDEQLETASLSDIEIGPTSISLVIDVVSRAGSTVSFLLPVNWIN